MKRVSPGQLCARSLLDLLKSPTTQRLVRFRSCQFESKMLGQIDDERVKQLNASLHRSQRGHALGARRAKFVLMQIAMIPGPKCLNRGFDLFGSRAATWQ